MLAGMGEVLPGTGQHDHAGHGAGHGHGHGEPAHSHRAGALAGLRHVLRPHSHEAADKVDTAMEASAAGLRALWISLAALAVTAVLQSVVVALSGSVALLGDTLHNAADALTAVPLAIAFLIGRRPPTRRYTYGYGRAEDLAGVVIVLVIAASSVLAAAAAVIRFAHPRPVSDLPAVAAAALIGFLGNELVARYRIRVGRRIGSAALVADGLHARTDGFTSLAVLLGAGGVALGWRPADPLIGLVITVAILGVLRSAVGQVGARLMDAVDPDLVDQAAAAVTSVEGISGVRDLRIRWIGHTLRAEVDVTVPANLTVTEAHDLAHHAEAHLLNQVRRLTAATVHASPAGAHYQSGLVYGTTFRLLGYAGGRPESRCRWMCS